MLERKEREMSEKKNTKKNGLLKKALVAFLAVALIGTYTIPTYNTFATESDTPDEPLAVTETDSVQGDETLANTAPADYPPEGGFTPNDGAGNPPADYPGEGGDSLEGELGAGGPEGDTGAGDPGDLAGVDPGEGDEGPGDAETADDESLDDEEGLAEDEGLADDEEVAEAGFPETTLTAEMIDGTVITVKAAEGVLPAGTAMKAYRVILTDQLEALESVLSEKAADEGRALKDFIAYDITLYDAEGNEIQPDGEVSVTIDSPDFNDTAEGEFLQMYHAEDSDSIADMEKIAEGENTATVDHFSFYVMALEGPMLLASDIGITPATVGFPPHTIHYFIYNNISGEYDIFGLEEGIMEGLQATEPSPDPVNAVYGELGNFIGWSTVPNPKYDDRDALLYDFSTPVTDDLSLYAVFEKYYTVTFVPGAESPDGNTIRDVEENTKIGDILFPDDPEGYPGNHFVDWGAGDYKEMLVDGNITLRAIWQQDAESPPDTTHGSSWDNIWDNTYNGKTLAEILSGAVPLSGVFDLSSGNQQNFIDYLYWNPQTGKLYFLYFHPDTGNDFANSIGLLEAPYSIPGYPPPLNPPVFTYSSDEKIRYSVFEVDIPGGELPDVINLAIHYDSKGWEPQNQFALPATIGHGKEDQKYTIQYNNGRLGDWINSFEIVEAGSYPAPPSGLEYTKSINPWYAFLGWKSSIDITIDPNNPSPPDLDRIYQIEDIVNYTVSNNTVFTAQWSRPDNVHIIFDKNDDTESLATNPIPADKYAAYQGAYGFLPTITREGYIFEGWFTEEDGGYLVSENTTVNDAGPITLYAQWTPIDYWVTYDPDNGDPTWGAGPYNMGDTVTVSSAVPSWPEGYEFGGWTSDMDGDETVYKGGDTFEMPAGSVTLTAVWTLIIYYITYDFVGGEEAASGNYPNTYSVEKTPISITDAVRDGYIFLGWTVDFENAVLTDEDSPVLNYVIPHTMAVTVTGNIKLTAHWVPILTIISNGSTAVYDGTAHTVSGFTVIGTTPDGVLDFEALKELGFDVKVDTSNPTATNVGETKNEIDVKSISITYYGLDVTSILEVSLIVSEDVLKINPRPLTIAANSASKTYDGAPLTIGGYKITSGTTTAPGESVTSVKITGSQTPVGSSANVPSAAVIKNGVGETTSNYAIKYQNGTLTVDAPPYYPPVVPPVVPPSYPPAGPPAGPAPVVPAGPAAVPPPAPAPDPGPVVIPPADPPVAPEPPPPEPQVEIGTEPVPLTDTVISTWALFNLILTIITALIMLLLMITYFVGRRKKEDEGQEKTKLKRHLVLRLLTIVVTAGAVIMFVLTQDMSLPMGFYDGWTVWHAVLAIVTLALGLLSRKKAEESEPETLRA